MIHLRPTRPDPARARVQLLGHMMRKFFEAGSTIARGDDAADHLVVVISGRVLAVEPDDPDARPLCGLGPG